MHVSRQIAAVWAGQQEALRLVWWLLPQFGQAETDPAAVTKLQARITACLLMTPFSAESGRQVGAALAQHFRFHLEKFGRLQRLLAEQLLAELDEPQTAWLAPRLAAFWAEMTVGYGQTLRRLYLAEQTALQKQLHTQLQQAQKQATESEQRFETLFHNALHPIALHANGRILAVNQAVTDLAGYPPEALVGQTIETLLATLAPPAEQARLLTRIQSGENEPCQTEVITQDGTAVPVAVAPRQITYRGRQVRMILIRPLSDGFPRLPDLDEAALSSRQQAVLHHMAAGLSDAEIADQLEVTTATVHYHKRQIFKKLGVASRPEAIAWAWQKLDALPSSAS